MGVVPQLDNLDTTLDVQDNLRIFRAPARVPDGERAARRRGRSRKSPATARQPVDRRGGMRRRLLVARACTARRCCSWTSDGRPMNRGPWALIDALRGEGTSILMSTHYIEEADAPTP